MYYDVGREMIVRFVGSSMKSPWAVHWAGLVSPIVVFKTTRAEGIQLVKDVLGHAGGVIWVWNTGSEFEEDDGDLTLIEVAVRNKP